MTANKPKKRRSSYLAKHSRLILLFGLELLLGIAIARFAESPLLLILLLGALTVAALINLEYMLYVLMFFLPFSQRLRMVSISAEIQIPTEPLLAVLIIAFVLRKIIAPDFQTPIPRLRSAHASVGGGVGQDDKWEISRFPFWAPILAYIFSLLLSLINSPYRYFAAKGVFRAIAYVITVVLTFELIDSRERLKRLFIASIIPATISVGWTAILLATRINLWRSSSAYEGLLFTNYIYYGAFVAVIGLILLSRIFFDNTLFDRVRWTILLIFYAIALCLCFSRIVWVSVIAAVVFLIFQKSEDDRRHKKITIIAITGTFLLLLSIIPSISTTFYSRALTVFDSEYASNRNRLLRWGAALMMFLRHPIIGSGYNTFALSYENNPAHIGDYTLGTHNQYISILAEQGIIGFISWIWVLTAFFVHGFRLLKEAGESRQIDAGFWHSTIIGLMTAMLFFTVISMACNLLHSDRTGIPFYLIYGLLPAIGKMAKRQEVKG